MISNQVRTEDVRSMEVTPIEPAQLQHRQIRVNRISVPLGVIVAQASTYVNIPWFQRKKVWTKKFKEDLIDAVLRGVPIAAVQMYEQDEQGLTKNYIIDGQQRMTTFLAFYNNEFRTKRIKVIDGSIDFPPIEPGRLYRELSAISQQAFLNYYVNFDILMDVDHRLLGYMYLGAQNSMKLTSAEKLLAYSSHATRAGLHITQTHPFFVEGSQKDPDIRLYRGATLRQQDFNTVLLAMRLEIMGGFANVGQAIIRDLAMGKSDRFITPAFLETVECRLRSIQHLYAGVTITVQKHMIPLYQSIILLENIGVELPTVPSRTLSEWWENIVKEDNRHRSYSHQTLNATMGEVMHQKEFWRNNLAYIASLPSIAEPGDRERIASHVESVDSWLQHDGICPVCNEHAKLSERKSHGFGRTVFKNSCRDRLRASS